MIGSVWFSSTDNGPTSVGSIRCLSMARRIGLRSECSAPSWCAKEAVDRAKSSRRLGLEADVKRSVKKYRDEGIESFFRPRVAEAPTCSPRRPVARAQELLYRGGSPSEVADELEINRDTLRGHQSGTYPGDRRATDTRPPAEARAAARGQRESPLGPLRTSRNSLEDAAAPMGIACTRPLERVAAALGLLDGAPTEFQVCRDVSFGGVLCALPALTQNGLFDHLDECFPSLGGYYTTTQIVSVLALMALCRIQTVEQLQYLSWGTALADDQTVEVIHLRRLATSP